MTRGIVAEISGTTVWRWLSEDAIRPWRHRSWIFPRDPDFETKAARVLDLYARQWESKPLGKRDYVISADEKTSIQARIRRHPTLAPAAGRHRPRRARVRPGRRPRLPRRLGRAPGQGVRTLRAHDGHRAVRPAGRAGDDDRALRLGPGASYWVVDNGSSHRGEPRLVACLSARFHNARLVQLPVHASWLNQVEIYFSVVQRKVLTPNDFADLAEVADRLAIFERRYEQTAAPFRVAVHS